MQRSYSSSDQGLIAILRLFVGIRLVSSILAYISFTHLGNRSDFGQVFPWASIFESAFLLGYLSWGWLGEKMGKAYLPVALGVAILGPILESFVNTPAISNYELAQQRVFASQWELVILLVIPVILIAWRYSFRHLALSLAALTVLDGALILIKFGALGLRPWSSMTILIFRTLVYLLVGYVVSWLSAEQHRQNTRLTQANRQLTAAASTLEQLTISRERNRMARELHDTLAHSLSAVAVQLEAVNAVWETNPEQAQALLHQSLEMTRSGLSDTRRAIQALRTAAVVDLGLPLALRNLANSEAERGGYIIEVQAPDNLPRLPSEIEHGLFRIVEEALRNTTRHAGANHVRVELGQPDHRLELIIQDDGCGFDNSSVVRADHYGLRGIRERAEAIGADLLIESQAGHGTKVRLDLEHLDLEMENDAGFNM